MEYAARFSWAESAKAGSQGVYVVLRGAVFKRGWVRG